MRMAASKPSPTRSTKRSAYSASRVTCGWARTKSASMPLNQRRPIAAGKARRRRPRTDAAPSVASCSASAISRLASRTRTTRRSPSSVKRSCRVVRSTRRMPRRCSSALRRLDSTVGWRANCRPAAEKEPCSCRASKVASSSARRLSKASMARLCGWVSQVVRISAPSDSPCSRSSWALAASVNG
ncbi:hypothetical protein D3C79_716770 [compost metagenome]